MVEHSLGKGEVTSSILVKGSTNRPDSVAEVGAAREFSPCGSVVEHSLGKGEVAGPIPAKGTR